MQWFAIAAIVTGLVLNVTAHVTAGEGGAGLDRLPRTLALFIVGDALVVFGIVYFIVRAL